MQDLPTLLHLAKSLYFLIERQLREKNLERERKKEKRKLELTTA